MKGISMAVTGAAALFMALQSTLSPAPSNPAVPQSVPVYWVVGLLATIVMVFGGVLVSIRMARIAEIRKELMDDSARRTKELTESLQSMFRNEFGPVKDAVEKFPTKVDGLIAEHKSSCDGSGGRKVMVARG